MKDGAFPPTDMYGIKTAKICGLPLEIIQAAEQTYRQISSGKRGSAGGNSDTDGVTEEERNMERKKRLLHHLLAFRYAELEYPGMYVQL